MSNVQETNKKSVRFEGSEQPVMTTIVLQLTEVLQIPEKEMQNEQQASSVVRELLATGEFQCQAILVKREGTVMIRRSEGWRTVVPPVLWPKVLEEAHGSIWSGHLKGPQTTAKVSRAYWWPGMKRMIQEWVMTCRDCDSRKVPPPRIIPPSTPIGRLLGPGHRWAAADFERRERVCDCSRGVCVTLCSDQSSQAT